MSWSLILTFGDVAGVSLTGSPSVQPQINSAIAPSSAGKKRRPLLVNSFVLNLMLK
jgi:hypothetical protein